MKQRQILKVLSVIMGLSMLFSVSCAGNGGGNGGGHKHVFDRQVSEEKYLKSEKTCTEAMQYYYSCACGEKGEESYSVGTKGLHSYKAEVVGDDYVKSEATCQATAVYYKSCVYCGRSSNVNALTFTVEGFGDHQYTKEKVGGAYIAVEATKESPALYYKSCACGAVGTETFAYGQTIPDLTEEQKEDYKPVSLTLTMYDTETSTYGFTYNTAKEPLRPVIQFEKGNTLTENAQEVGANFSKWSSYNKDDTTFTYYVSKAEVQLEPATTYTYRVYDKYAECGSETVTFTTRDASSTSFTFSHMSDSQCDPSSGYNFGVVLNQIKDTSDFVLHTGDVVEWSKHESEWTDMLHENFQYLSKMPLMGIAGNHDSTYKSGTSEFWKHFNNKIPEQVSTKAGYYYSFTYSNAKFIMLNTNNSSGALDSPQYAWLINELKNNDSDWTIVGMHCPLYSIGQWGADPEKNRQSLALRAQLQGVFAEYGVDVVFQGHDHLISRTNPISADGKPTAETWRTENSVEYSVDPNGVIYVMDGMVGSNTKGVVAVAEGIYKYAQGSGSCTWADVTIDGNRLTLALKSYRGNETTLQKWGIVKTENAA